MKGVRLGQDELIRTYGISRRLAVRVGAWLARGVEITPTVLEIGGPGSAVEKFLLHNEMLSAAEGLDSSLAMKIAKETGADAEGAFVVVESPEGARVLALEEETLAEEGWQGQARDKQTALATTETAPPPAQLLEQREARQIFTDEEIARIKLEALAGADPASRVSALRKLLYAPISPQAKGGVYLRVLLDPDNAVRAEAVKSLESLGFHRDAADAVQAVFTGDARRRKAALRRIGDLLGKLQQAEVRIVLGILLEMFRESCVKGPDDPLLNVLEEAVPAMGAYPEIAPEIARVCVQHLLVDLVRTGPTLQGFLMRLAQSAPTPVLERLWEEISTVSEAGPRAVILGILIEIEPDETRRKRLCDILVEELLRDDQSELARRDLGHAMIALGSPAADALMAKFTSGSNSQRAMLVPFIDSLGMDQGLASNEKRRVAEQLIDALRMADRRLRMEILGSRVFRQEEIPLGLRETVARELIPMLEAVEEHPEMLDRAGALLDDLGPAAAPGLFEMIRSRPAAPEADRAVRVLGPILARRDADPKVSAKLIPAVFSFLRGRVGRLDNRLGGYVLALGQIGASGGVDDGDAQRAFDLLAGQVARVPCQADTVEALGLLGACAAVTPQQRVRTAHLLGVLVDRPPDEEETVLRPVETDAGPVYELTGRTEFDSATLPAAVHGLEKIALSEHTSDALRDRIARQLLRVWQGVATWKLVWGPRGSGALAHALGAIGADGRADDALTAEIITDLSLAPERISVVRALHCIFGAPSGSAEVDRLCVDVALKMLEHWIEPEIMPDELQAVLTTAARAAARPGLTSRSSRARRLRQRTADLLFGAIKAGRLWVRAPLEQMRDCPTMSARLRKEIAGRLEKAFGSGGA